MRIQGSFSGADRRRANMRWRLLCVALATSAMGGQAVLGGTNGGRGGTAGGGPARMYVDDDAAPGGDGASWTTAFADLQSALDAAAGMPGQSIEIRVGQGTYAPSKRTDEADPLPVTFRLLNGVSLLGGFAGVGADDPDSRDPALQPTVLSGDVQGDDTPQYGNTRDNALHVVTSAQNDSTAVIDGFTITRGESGDGAGASITAGSPRFLRCRFFDNHSGFAGGAYVADASPTMSYCVFEGNSGSAVLVGAGSEPAFAHCEFRDNVADTEEFDGVGGAIYFSPQSTVNLSDCLFVGNHADGPGGAIYAVVDAPISMINCVFIDNSSNLFGGAALLTTASSSLIQGCEVKHNTAFTTAGLGVSAQTALLLDDRFSENEAEFVGGAILFTQTQAEVVNCVFSRNSSGSQTGSAIRAGSNDVLTIRNSSFSQNKNGAVTVNNTSQHLTTIRNCIFWNNAVFQVQAPSLSVAYSDVQGGAPGVGNISTDPFFIQPGCDDLRLGYGSPCMDAGDNASVHPGSSTDLDGRPRIQNGIVDMGAYEGGHEMLPLAACEDDLDEGEQVAMTPAGGPYNPINNAAISITNITETPDATASAAQIDQPLHPGAPGFNELAADLAVTTSLAGGDMFMRVTIPFDESDLNGFAIEDMNASWFDAAAAGDGGGAWRLAPEGDVALSPDHPGVMGDRIVVLTGGSPGFTRDVGDHGVFWNPALERGYVWANVDHAGEFAAGVALPACVGDTAYPVDGVVNMADLQRVIESWGPTPAGPASFADLDRNGVVDIDDLMAVVRGWGPCAR